MSKFKAFNLRQIGASHIREGKPCQDFSLSSTGEEYAVAIVCDGHGGSKYFRSERGSQLAAQKTLDSVFDFMHSRFSKDINGKKIVDRLMVDPENFINQLTANIIFRWREAVTNDYILNPFTDSELAVLTDTEQVEFQENEGWVTAYGTTLLAAVRAKKFWFGLHIGDGKCVTISETDELEQPIPWDEKCFLNQTTSLCDSQALTRFRHFFSTQNLPSAIFLGSDGVDDSFGSDEALNDFYKKVKNKLNEKGMVEGLKELQSFLPVLSEKGSQDDISIAGIWLIKTKGNS